MNKIKILRWLGCLTIICAQVHMATAQTSKKKTDPSQKKVNSKSAVKAAPAPKNQAVTPQATTENKTTAAPVAEEPRLTKGQISQETAVEEILVPYFIIATKQRDIRTVLAERRERIQQLLTIELNRKSYLEAKTVAREVARNGDVNILRSFRASSGAVLTGEFDGLILKLSLRSTMSGRSLMDWSIPIPVPLDDSSEKNFLEDIVDSIVTDFPYRGYVISSKDNLVKLNLGKKQALSVGTKLTVFEFEGDDPDFSSPKKNLGDVIITQVAPNEAVGTFRGKSGGVPNFAKVAFEEQKVKSDAYIENRNYSRFWLSAGTEYMYLDTQVSDQTNNSLKRRQYQLSLTPFYKIGGGAGRFQGEASYASAVGDKATVSFILAQFTYEYLRFNFNRWGLVTSIGIGGSQYTSQPKANAVNPPVSTYSASVITEQHVQWVASPRTKVFGSLQLKIPTFSNDEINGDGVPFVSYGFRLHGGLRLDLSNLVAVENTISSQVMHYVFQDARALDEGSLGINLKALFKF